jgi:hypothetical protein
MSYTEIELAKLIETVEKEFTVHLNKAEELHSLAKAEESAPPKEKKESKPPEKKEAAPKEAAPAEGEAAPAEEEAAPEEGAFPAEGEAAPEEGQEAAPAAPGAAAPMGGAYDEEDMAHMCQMYASMSREELMAHHDCVRQALDAMSAQAPAAPGMEAAPEAAPEAAAAPMKMGMSEKMGKSEKPGHSELSEENPVINSKPTDKGDNMFPDKKNGGIKGAPPHNALGAKSAASAANGAKINKSEFDRRNGGKQDAAAPGKIPGAKSPASDASKAVQMHKSEGNVEVELLKSELEAEKASSAELKKSFDKATEVLAKLVSKVTVPQGKAITELGTITKGEDITGSKELSKSEVTELLKKQDYSKLTKSDRDAINSFYLGGSNFNTISHLFKN